MEITKEQIETPALLIDLDIPYPSATKGTIIFSAFLASFKIGAGRIIEDDGFF
jgi:hypothetical protein